MGGRPRDDALDPPVQCCGREFTLRRAYQCHVGSHIACTRCAFTGCRAALKAHEWESHGLGRPPPTQVREGAATRADDDSAPSFARRDGGSFTIVDELEAELAPLEERFPGAQISWPLSSSGSDRPAEWSGDGEEDSAPAPPPCDDVEWPPDCRLLLLLGATASGKSTLLRSLARRAGAGSVVGLEDARSLWPTELSILDGLGADGARWLSAVGLGSVPLWCQPYGALSTGEAFRAELARRLQQACLSGAPRDRRDSAPRDHPARPPCDPPRDLHA